VRTWEDSANSWHSVILFILLVGRCCFCIQRGEGAFTLRKRIFDEEEVLLALTERRKQLEEETGALEARRSTLERPLPPVPAETIASGNGQHELVEQRTEEDLIDMAADDR
jgi:hypothetical protein